MNHLGILSQILMRSMVPSQTQTDLMELLQIMIDMTAHSQTVTAMMEHLRTMIDMMVHSQRMIPTMVPSKIQTDMMVHSQTMTGTTDALSPTDMMGVSSLLKQHLVASTFLQCVNHKVWRVLLVFGAAADHQVVCHGLQHSSLSDQHSHILGEAHSEWAADHQVFLWEVVQWVECQHHDLHRLLLRHIHHLLRICIHNHNHSHNLSQFHNQYHSHHVRSVSRRHQSHSEDLQHSTGTFRVQTVSSTEQESWVSDRLHSQVHV
jgi:hypothetical protein